MGVFDKEIRTIRNLEKEIIPTVIESLKKFDFVVIDFITNKQMQQKGEDGSGALIGDGKYSGGYSRIRIKRGLQVNHIDLRFSGRFHADIEVITDQNQFRINSSVSYANDIIKKYGIKVLEIQQRYLEEFVSNYLVPQIKLMINGELARSNN